MKYDTLPLFDAFLCLCVWEKTFKYSLLFPRFFLTRSVFGHIDKSFLCGYFISCCIIYFRHWQKSLYRLKRNMVLVELDQHVESCFSFGKIILLSLRHIILSPPNLVKR